MPQLIMKDGKKTFVQYDKAARINQILEGTKEPADQAQKDFCDNVLEVRFEDLPIKKTFTRKRKIIERDEVMHNIMNDSSIKGHDKFTAILRRIKERVEVNN